MATLYTRIYTYKKQTSWTSSDRTAPWSNFVMSGDTDKNVGHIVGITYEHVNNSHSSRDWGLQGGIVLSDGTLFLSDTVTQYIGRNKAVSFTNTFTNLPTAEQFTTISAIRTYANNSYTDNDVLTWRADSSYPMRVIVTFYEEEPLTYKPTIEKFEAVRGVSSGLYATGRRDDNGTDALFTIKLSAQSRDSSLDSIASVYLYYAEGTVSTSSPSISMRYYFTSHLLTGITDAEISTSIVVESDKDYNFLLVFTYGNETTMARASISNTFVALHISSCSTGGVSIGDISTSTEGNPKFEVHHPAFFKKSVYLEGGISQIESGSAFQYGVLTTDTTVGDGKTADQIIKFSPEFSEVPCLFITPICSKSKLFYVVTEITTNQATVRFFNDGSGDYTATVQWLAISGGTNSAGGGSSSGSEDDEGGSGESGTNSSVSASANYSSGLEIMTITIDDVPLKIFVPTSNAVNSSSSSLLATAAAVNAMRSIGLGSASMLTSGNTRYLRTSYMNGTVAADLKLYSYGSSLPSSGSEGDLFFLT